MSAAELENGESSRTTDGGRVGCAFSEVGGARLKLARERVAIEITGPAGDDEGCDAVTNDIGQGARFRHKTVHAENQSQAADGQIAYQRQRCGEYDEAAAGDAGCAFGGQKQYGEQGQLLHQSDGRVGGLGDKYSGHCEVDRCAVEIE